MTMGCVNKYLTKVFFHLGDIIARFPKSFIIGSTLLSFILGLGMLRLEYVNNVEYLYTVSNGQGKFDRYEVEKLFPPNYTTRFDPSRETKILRFARIIFLAKDGESLLKSEAWAEMMAVDKIIHSVEINWKGQTHNYSTLCAKWHDACYENDHLELGDMLNDGEVGVLTSGSKNQSEPAANSIFGEKSSKIRYPIMFHPKSFKTHVLPQYFGGIGLTNDSYSLKMVRAIVVTYFIDVENDEDDLRGGKWEAEVLKRLAEKENDWKAIKVNPLTFETFFTEMDRNFFSAVPIFAVTVVLMGCFTVSTSMMSDWVRSKFWLGILGMVSSGLGTLSSLGVLCFIGVPFIGINMAVPFIMLGIGIDDTFVFMASWRRTSVHDSVPRRLAECYSEAAVSVTITSLTDMLSFYVGVLTPIPSVQIFSAYAGTGVLFIYFWHLIFFGAWMAITGYQEAENRHAIFWWIKCVPKSQSDNISKFEKLFNTGGVNEKDPFNPRDVTENCAMSFFRDQFSEILNKPFVKAAVIVSFVIYVLISLWGVTKMEEGLRQERLVLDDSYMKDYIELENKYFRDFAYRVQIIVKTPMDYSADDNQKKIQGMLNDFYAIDGVIESYSENWLRDFMRYMNTYKELYDFNMTTEGDFIKTLKNDYLNDNMVTSQDIALNNDSSRITASRFIIQTVKLYDTNIEIELLTNLRRVAAEQKDRRGLDVFIFHTHFHFTDQYMIIRDLTIKMVSIAAVIVMIVAIIFIPNLCCALCILFSIASIELGVLGFMSLWNVNLDLISIICLIMCIGFSVDFSAHISYAYIVGEKGNSHERVSEALYSLGLPVLQGAISTIIGVLGLLVVHSYIFQTIFKIVILVICFAIWHGLVLLPVLLSIFKPENGILFRFRFFYKQSKSYELDH